MGTRGVGLCKGQDAMRRQRGDGTICELFLRRFYVGQILSQTFVCFIRTKYFSIVFPGSYDIFFPCKFRWDKCSHKINISLSLKTTDK